MNLDFITLYIVILLNSVGFTIVWGLISYNYKTIAAARLWFLSLLMTCIAGPLLALGESYRLFTYIGILMTVGGFALIWQGVRVFHNHPPQWSHVVLLLSTSMVAMMVFGSTPEADNIIFALSQTVPIMLTIRCLWVFSRMSLGSGVASAAGGLFVLGQGCEAAANVLRLTGHMNSNDYYSVAAWFLVCAIIGGSVLNLGLLLIVTDRLRAELYALATRDDLTGLPNRRALRERIRLTEKSARRTNHGVVVVMVDLDQFKAINDRHGHVAGDAALIHVGKVLASCLRDFDFLARIGGDEFCILLPGTGTIVATALTERINEALKANSMEWHGVKIPVLASIGFTAWHPGSEKPLIDCLETADDEMFACKRRGRSRPARDAPMRAFAL